VCETIGQVWIHRTRTRRARRTRRYGERGGPGQHGEVWLLWREGIDQIRSLYVGVVLLDVDTLLLKPMDRLFLILCWIPRNYHFRKI
jgi:hypothetical protein